MVCKMVGNFLLSLDPVTLTILGGIVSGVTGGIVRPLVTHAIRRWVPDPRLTKPEVEYII
jgi:hypothetical protein